MHFFSQFLMRLVLLTAQILLGMEHEVTSAWRCSFSSSLLVPSSRHAGFISTWILIQLKIVSSISEGSQIITLVIRQKAAFFCFFLLRCPNQVTTSHKLLKIGENPQGHGESRYDHEEGSPLSCVHILNWCVFQLMQSFLFKLAVIWTVWILVTHYYFGISEK